MEDSLLQADWRTLLSSLCGFFIQWCMIWSEHSLHYWTFLLEVYLPPASSKGQLVSGLPEKGEHQQVERHAQKHSRSTRPASESMVLVVLCPLITSVQTETCTIISSSSTWYEPSSHPVPWCSCALLQQHSISVLYFVLWTFIVHRVFVWVQRNLLWFLKLSSVCVELWFNWFFLIHPTSVVLLALNWKQSFLSLLENAVDLSCVWFFYFWWNLWLTFRKWLSVNLLFIL